VIHLERNIFVVEWPHGGRMIKARPQPHLGCLCGEMVDKGLAHRMMNQDPFGCRTDLTCIAESSFRDAPRRQGEIGVIKDDGGAIAAQFEHKKLAGPTLSNELAGFRAAGERNDLSTGIDNQFIAGRWALAVNEVDDTLR